MSTPSGRTTRYVPNEILAAMPDEWTDGTCPECGFPATWTAESGMFTNAQVYVHCQSCGEVDYFVLNNE